ncbi:MAG TPA: dUTP diphosphatase [Candidatus Cloacimonadota bacterium]|nr:dUTP diphosphatase [Candidatus Cloacimonadota bacterium]HPT72489.1 dUTP diphosphatase [Candidatus Cloacimonadota bacterium]
MTEHAAGYDLFADIPQEQVILPQQVLMIKTGIAISLPVGYEAQIRPRSGLAAKHRIGVLNSPGTIDADYRGEIQVILYNFGDTEFTVTPKMRIAQMIISKHEVISFEEVDDLDETTRGAGGFGHSSY